jgi:hypothetical protein
MKNRVGVFLVVIILSTMPVSRMCFSMISSGAQKNHRFMMGSAAKGAASSGMHVVPDLDQRLARWQKVRMPFRTKGLSPREVRMIGKLVDACRLLDEIYWRQNDPEGLLIYQSLAGSANPRDLKVRHFLRINGSRFDLLDSNKPFLGTDPLSPGHGFYPAQLTREQVEQYVKEHPDKKDEIYSPITVIRWHDKELEALPYHIAFRSLLEPAARDLREAAKLSDDGAFANFLRLRADALLSDDYYQSDLAWVDLKDPKVDIIFAPYETYDDELLGVKGSFGGAVLVRDAGETRKLALFQKYVPEIQDALPLSPEDKPSKRGQETPMEVMDAPFRAGDLRHGYQAVADNLPNDPRIHEAKGTKKIFFKNFLDARVNYVILPVAKHVMRPDQAVKATADGYLVTTIMHEIAHGIGPAFSRTASGKADIRESIGPAFSGLEEAKADVVGLFGLKWLVDHDVLPKNKLEEYYASYVAGIFRTVRFGTAEAHSRGEMMEFNYLAERGAIKRETTGRYVLDYAVMPTAVEGLVKELLEIEATGDRGRAEQWFAKYSTMPEELKISLKAASSVPVDIDPVFSFPEK